MSTPMRIKESCVRSAAFKASTAPRRPVRVLASKSPRAEIEASASSRRQALLAGLALVPLFNQRSAFAQAESNLCVLQTSDEAAEACRKRLIERDAGKQENYNDVSERKGFGTVSGVPVSVLDDEYSRSSIALIDEIEKYCTLDLYSKERVPLIKKLKVDANSWVSKYARGGNVRSLSARKLYIAVDGVTGFLASNGLAPFPNAKAKLVMANLEESRAFLLEGK
mmetsp:Transcript_2723/g.6012  ORF Transcript_2723/g.6012 Transcript_2723/m.6012 type:complete len:224 (+) Transcript_2723:156-827(+)